MRGLPATESYKALLAYPAGWAGEARIYHHRGPTDAELAAEHANIEQIAAFILPLCSPDCTDTGRVFDYKTRAFQDFRGPV